MPRILGAPSRCLMSCSGCASPIPPDITELEEAIAGRYCACWSWRQIRSSSRCSVPRTPLSLGNPADFSVDPRGADWRVQNRHRGPVPAALRRRAGRATPSRITGPARLIFVSYLQFAAKDVLLVIDDFAPCGGPSDVLCAHREADRVLRGQGNRAGRGRMRSD